MFNSEIFNLEVYPDFNEEMQCKLRVFDKDVQKLKVVDTIDIKRLPKRESILVLAVVDVTLLKEEHLYEQKKALQKRLQKEAKHTGKENFDNNLQIISMLANKSKKIDLLKVYKKELELKLMQQ